MSKSVSKGVSEIPATPFAFLWFTIQPYKKWFFWAVLFTLLVCIFSGLQTYTFKEFIDTANAYSIDGTGSLRTVFLWILAYPLLLFFITASIRANGFMQNFLTVHIRTRAVKVLFSYLSLHSASYFNDRFSGALSEKVANISGNVGRLVSLFLWHLTDFIFTFIISSSLIYAANKNLAFAFMIGFFVLIPINLWLTRRQLHLSKKLAELSAKLRGSVIDVITNISAVQQYARRTFEIERLDKSIVVYRDADVTSDNFREKILLINNFLITTFIGIIILWGFYIWSKELISIGTFVLILTLTRNFMRDLTFIGQHLNHIMEMYGELQNGLEEIIKPHDITDKIDAKKLQVSDGSINFNDVTFAYDKDPRKVFNHLSFEVKGREKIGVVGTSGTGKSTLMKLLLRQHDITGGTVLIDSQDIRDVTQESLREKIAIVPQEPMLFHRTIRENIMYGKLHATEHEMIEVAKKAQAHDFIELLPQKYDSLVGERGVKLSVGQRQRIIIARAFLKNAPILILDEATSALDSESEVAVQEALHALMDGKTVFAIAHRLSTLRDMDRILVFKEGRIIEDGSHKTLVKNKEGLYHSFWNHQAGGFIKEA